MRIVEWVLVHTGRTTFEPVNNGMGGSDEAEIYGL